MPEAAPPQDEQMRVAFSIPNSNPDLRIVHRTQTLKDLIQELAEQHKLPGTGADYSLVFQKGIKIKDYRIVTEKNRSEMNAKYGNVIEIAESASKSVSNILLDLEGGDGEKRSKALSALNRMSVDYTFALEFFFEKRSITTDGVDQQQPAPKSDRHSKSAGQHCSLDGAGGGLR